MTLTFPGHARQRMNQCRITIHQVYVVVNRGRSYPTWRGRTLYRHEVDSRFIIVVLEGSTVVTAFRPRWRRR